MTRNELAMLLEAVENAPIIRSEIKVTVGNTNYSFGMGVPYFLTKESLIKQIKERCGRRLTSSHSLREEEKRIYERQIYYVRQMIRKRDNLTKKGIYYYKQEDNKEWVRCQESERHRKNVIDIRV